MTRPMLLTDIYQLLIQRAQDDLLTLAQRVSNVRVDTTSPKPAVLSDLTPEWIYDHSGISFYRFNDEETAIDFIKDIQDIYALSNPVDQIARMKIITKEFSPTYRISEEPIILKKAV